MISVFFVLFCFVCLIDTIIQNLPADCEVVTKLNATSFLSSKESD